MPPNPSPNLTPYPNPTPKPTPTPTLTLPLTPALSLSLTLACRMGVPALAYTVQGNLLFVALAHLEAPTYQVRTHP